MTTELRAPDPTLDDLGAAAVYVTDPLGSPSVAHRASRSCGISARSGDFQNAYDARWFAVPCRKCFPDAPEPGGGRDCSRPDCTVNHAKYLAWQVAR